MAKLQRIDEFILTDHEHYYLSPEDVCYFFYTYTSGAGYSTPTNQLISNYKKSVTTQNTPQWKYKLNAIQEVAGLLKNGLLPRMNADTTCIVPVPPSKRKDHPEYDDRNTRVLKLLGSCAVNDIILSRENLTASHNTSNRPTPITLEANYYLDEGQCAMLKENIILFDDVLTTGAHYIACRNAILRKFPDKTINGVFVARRAI